MINNDMSQTPKQPAPQKPKKPDENSGIHLQGFVKILDPETKEVKFEGRA